MGKGKFIDIEKVIAEKNPAVLKWMPSVILNYLKNVMHQDEMNDFLELHKDKQDELFCQAVVDYMNLTVEVVGLEKIPKDERIVLVMNHPLGGMDAMILITALNERRNDLKFIVNDILMNLENMEDMFVGIDKHGKSNKSMRIQIQELFESDVAVCIFPAGLVSREINGEVEDLTWKKTFVTYSKENERTIIPIFIDGNLSKFFYRLSRLRKFFRIKLNIEMLYHSNELFKQRGKHVDFVVGNPIENDYLFGGLGDRKLAEGIKNKTYELRNQL